MRDRQPFTIPAELYARGGAWPLPAEQQALYQLPSAQVNIGDMLREVQKALPGKIQTARRRGIESPAWGNLISIKDYENLGDLFEPITGAIRLPNTSTLPEGSPLRTFYEKPGRTYVTNDGITENRGARYYAIADHEIGTPEAKLAVMREEISDSLHVLRNTDRTQLSKDDYLFYLGVTDVLKQNLLALFHSFTFPERSGTHTPDQTYHEYKQIAWDLARTATRRHYQTLLGQELTLRDPFDDSKIDDLMEYFLKQAPHPAQFKLQEIDHPLLIALGAHETALKHPDVDTVVALPSGGTQIGIVTQLMFDIHPELREIRQGNSPELITVPLSTHSGKRALDNGSFTLDGLIRYLRTHYADEISGKKVLVTEDNANRGKTAEMIYTALTSARARQVHVSLVELDPERIIFKQLLPEEERPQDVINIAHPDFSTAVGIVPMQIVEGTDTQSRKLRAREVLNASRRN